VTALLVADFPAGLDLDLPFVVETLAEQGSFDVLLTARRAMAGFAPADHDPNTLAMMTRLIQLGWNANDLADLRSEWPQSHGHGGYHLFRLAWTHARQEGLPPAEIRAGLPTLYPDGTNQPERIKPWPSE
jgi:hypothetical protein